MNTICIVILAAFALYVCFLICKVWLARRRLAKVVESSKPVPVPPRPFILKIIEMIEKEDFKYEAENLSEVRSYREVYRFALETNLKCELSRSHNWAATLLQSSYPMWWLSLDDEAVSMTEAETNLLADALDGAAARRRERERLEKDAKRAPLIAAIESYTVVDRRTSQ